MVLTLTDILAGANNCVELLQVQALYTLVGHTYNLASVRNNTTSFEFLSNSKDIHWRRSSLLSALYLMNQSVVSNETYKDASQACRKKDVIRVC